MRLAPVLVLGIVLPLLGCAGGARARGAAEGEPAPTLVPAPTPPTALAPAAPVPAQVWPIEYFQISDG